MHGPAQAVKKFLTVNKRCHHTVKSFRTLSETEIHNGTGLAESPAKLHDFTRHYLACSSTGNDSLEVSYIPDHSLQTPQIVLIIKEMLHRRMPVSKFGKVHDRHGKPCPQHAGSHRRRTLVHDFHQRSSFLSCRR